MKISVIRKNRGQRSSAHIKKRSRIREKKLQSKSELWDTDLDVKKNFKNIGVSKDVNNPKDVIKMNKIENGFV